jgi:hypothetical protein
MNPQSANVMNRNSETMWASLSKAAAFFCADRRALPIQWIFMVDDAWFHPSAIQFETLKDEFDTYNNGIPFNQPIFKDKARGKILSWKCRSVVFNQKAESTATVEQTNEQSQEELGAVQQSPSKPFNDQQIAELVGQLATDRGYGICFCSFEYFWTHYNTKINIPYHAVFFDINHALRGLPSCKELDTKWKEELNKTNFYGDTTINNHGIHGWLLHYAIKLGCEPLLRTAVSASHILLVSSNFAEQGGSGTPNGDKNPATQFGTVTLDMWTKLFTPGSSLALPPEACMADFGFSPFQKVAQSTDTKAEMLKNGFKFFDRTFSKAASWEHFRKALLEDMLLIWKDPRCLMGHDACKADKSKLRAIAWIETKDRDEQLAGAHHLHNDAARKCPVTANSLLAFLKQALLLPDLALPEGTEEWTLLYPTSPGVAYLIGIADLYDTMCVLKENRSKPEVKLEIEGTNGSEMLCVRFYIPQSDVPILQTIAGKEDKIKEDKSGGAIQRLMHKAKVLLHHFKNGELNGIQCHKMSCQTNPCQCTNCTEVLNNCCCNKQALVTFRENGNEQGYISMAFNKRNKKCNL